MGFPPFRDENGVNCFGNTWKKCHEKEPGGQMVKRHATILYLPADKFEEEHPRRMLKFSHEDAFTETQN